MSSILGTASVSAQALSGAANITVPEGCNGIAALWSHWDNNDDTTLTTLSIDGESFLPPLAALNEGAVTDESGIGVAVLLTPSTGAQQLSWAWPSPQELGGAIFLVYLDIDVVADPVRDAGVNAAVSDNPCAVTIDSQTGDLVIALGQSFVDGAADDEANITNQATSLADNVVVNGFVCNLVTLPAGEPQTTAAIAASSLNYSAIAAISIKSAGGATIEADTAAASFNAHDATITLAQTVNADTAAAELATFAAQVTLSKTVSADTARIAATGQTASVQLGSAIAAQVARISATARQAVISLAKTVSAGTAVIAATANVATIAITNFISANTAQAAFSTHRATITSTVEIRSSRKAGLRFGFPFGF